MTTQHTPEQQKLLSALVKESAQYLDKIDELKFQNKEVVSTASDKDGKIGIPATEFNQLVKSYREKEKVEEQVAKLTNSLVAASFIK